LFYQIKSINFNSTLKYLQQIICEHYNFLGVVFWGTPCPTLTTATLVYGYRYRRGDVILAIFAILVPDLKTKIQNVPFFVPTFLGFPSFQGLPLFYNKPPKPIK